VTKEIDSLNKQNKKKKKRGEYKSSAPSDQGGSRVRPIVPCWVVVLEKKEERLGKRPAFPRTEVGVQKSLGFHFYAGKRESDREIFNFVKEKSKREKTETLGELLKAGKE